MIMAKYKKKPLIVEAYQWFKLSTKDHVETFRYQSCDECKECGKLLPHHGWIHTLEGGHIVCPSDWIITGIRGEQYPCKDDIFKETYESVSLVAI